MRVKLQVWSPVLRQWKTAWCPPELLFGNIRLLHSYGFATRVG